MGAWSSVSFGNDDAADWVYELEESGIGAIRETLESVVAEEGYLEASDACCAVAAAEVVAASLGQPPPDELPDEVTEFLQSEPAIGVDLVDLARKAVARVLSRDSELFELWRDTPEFDAWKAGIDSIAARLAAPPAES